MSCTSFCATKWGCLVIFVACIIWGLTSGPPSKTKAPSRRSTFLYFAYGSNLLTERIHFQNPSATFKSAAQLDGYKLEFRLPSKRWNGCAATITESPGESMFGCLWELDMDHLKTLDNQEGVHQGFYERIKVEVTTVNTNSVLEVFTYLGQEERMLDRDEECLPSGAYKNVIVKGAIEHQLPDKYIEKLRQIKDNGYVGEVDLSVSA